MHLPFLKMHNAVVRPHLGRVNPYHVGFYIFQKLEREFGLERCFEVREISDDVSALRMLLDEEDFRELNFFSYENKKDGSAVVSEVVDHDDWKLVRNELINVLNQDYIRTAKAKGLSQFNIIRNHALKNALNPVVTVISGWFASLLAGSVFVEFIFGWNGIGKEIVNALNQLDLPVIMGAVLVIALMFIIINILVDIIYVKLDPRIKIN